ncbi:MAG: N-acetylmuramoyl-L-alanine amidase [Lachnospiraceae bacterium]|nr:N-acetylmuramoyl-L-alanine amidase [Lachnospiraceae bacterium]
MVRSLMMIVRLLTVGILTGMMIVCGIVFFDKLHSIVSGADAGKMIVCAAEKDVYDTLRIVIDPGHGGENLGGEYEDYTEKEMTIVVAEAMKEELEKYEGVSVYLTRNGDQELSLEERCEYAKSVDADFLFCLHFNLSEHHTLFGAECWVSAFGENYSKGYAFASVEMELLQELGLYSRGIKTRLGSTGLDYYGIIRHATERDIPCVLIEHCHLDQDNDKPFYDHDDKLKAFGRLDATAVAKYFNLSSEELGVDYSGYQNVVVDVPADLVAPDSTEPEFCIIEVLEQNADNGEVTVQVSAADRDSGMLYYAYSYDGGETFSELLRWPDRSSDTFHFTMQVPPRVVPRIVVNSYNGYDLYTASNMVSLPAMDYKTPEEIAAQLAEKEALESASGDVRPIEDRAGEPETDGREERMYDGFLIAVCIVCALLILGMAVSMAMILRGRHRRRRSKRRRRRKRRRDSSS